MKRLTASEKKHKKTIENLKDTGNDKINDVTANNELNNFSVTDKIQQKDIFTSKEYKEIDLAQNM